MPIKRTHSTLRAAVVTSFVGLSLNASAITLEAYFRDLLESPTLTVEDAALMGVLNNTFQGLRDPGSFEISDLFVKASQTVAIGCMEYRAKNGFGGYNVSQSVWRFSLVKDRPSLIFTDKISEWNRSCTGEGFTDKKSQGKYIVDRMKKKL